MKVLITGANGQLGQSLQQVSPRDITAIATDINELDLAATDKLRSALRQIDADAVINAAAYTAVDKAESEPDLAQTVNAEAAGIIAAYCCELNIPLIHVSTDFVFDGESTVPYTPESKTSPLCVYGESKLAGEQAVHGFYPDAHIVRSGWIYSEHGNNFVKTMLRLAAENNPIKIVCDQTGTPTYARNLAVALWRLLEVMPSERRLHYADGGQTNWYEFAVAIFDEAAKHGLLSEKPDVSPISTADYPTPARRPAYSVLDCSGALAVLGMQQIPWRDSLCDMLTRLAQHQDVRPAQTNQ